MSLVILSPLLSSVCVGLYGFRLGTKGAVLIVLSSLIVSWISACCCFYNFLNVLTPTYLVLFKWIKVGLVCIDWNIYCDALTASMFLLVTTISSLVYIYSVAYLAEDPHIVRFSIYIALFTFFMLILIASNNIVQLFLGWEGVGICSYLLISFWYTRLQSNKAAIQAVAVNKIGDVGVLLAASAIFSVSKSFDFSTLFTVVPYIGSIFICGNIEVAVLPTITLLLFIGTIGKSAQLGFHIWLPSAMEGPTPVSALIHAATMVTAGIFLIIRCAPLFECTDSILVIVTIIGALTAFFAATVGLVQNDLKRIIAYSTCSQLGYMVLACGLSNYSSAFFHLLNHGCFKALLFLSAGSIIHSLTDEQDIRKMGGLSKLVPITYCSFVVGSMALTGFPFLSGYYSKEFLLETSFSLYSNLSTFAYLLGITSTFCTSLYSIRLLYLTFWSSPNSTWATIKGVHESPLPILVPILVLTGASIVVGYLSKDVFIGLGSSFWGNSIFITPNHYTYIEAESLPLLIKLTPLLLSGLGMIVALFIQSTFSRYLAQCVMVQNYPLYWFFNQRWYVESMYNIFILRPLFNFGYSTSFTILDKGLLEIAGPQGSVLKVTQIAKLATVSQTGLPYHYTLIMLVGLYCFVNLVLLFETTVVAFGLDVLLYYIVNMFVIILVI